MLPMLWEIFNLITLILSDNDAKEERIIALEGKVEKLQQESELQQNVIEKLVAEVEDLKTQLNDTNTELEKHDNHFKDIQGKS